MFLIDVVQFHRPNGRQENGMVSIDDRYQNKYNSIRKLGLRFTIEVLGATNQVSVCLEEPGLGDMLIELIPIEQSITPAIEKMLDQWTEEKYAKWSPWYD